MPKLFFSGFPLKATNANDICTLYFNHRFENRLFLTCTLYFYPKVEVWDVVLLKAGHQPDPNKVQDFSFIWSYKESVPYIFYYKTELILQKLQEIFKSQSFVI